MILNLIKKWRKQLIPIICVCLIATSTLLASAAGTTATSAIVPFTLKQAGSTTTFITLAWTDNKSITGTAGYTVFRNGSKIAQKLKGKTYSDKNLKPGTKYTYVVKVVNNVGISLRSSSFVVMSTKTLPDTTAPTVPQNVTQQSVTEQTAIISWNASTDNVKVTGYELLRNGTRIAVVPVLQYGDSGLQPGTTYTYTVRAFDDAKNTSTPSKPLSLTTKSTIVEPPPNLYKYNFPSVYLRGTFNQFAANRPMTLISDHVWQVAVTFSGKMNDQFKFDIKGDWTQNYGDTEGDLKADPDSAALISVMEGPGTYKITWNDETLEYGLELTAPGQNDSTTTASINLTDSNYSLIAGQTDYLQVDVSGLSATPKLLWKSSDDTVLSVNEETIRGLKAGTAFVMIALASDPTVFDVCEVNVTADNRHPVFRDPDLNYVFDISALPTVTLEVPTKEWNTLLTNFDTNPKNELEVQADFTFNKNGKVEKLSQIGIRLRGNTSRERPEGLEGQLHNAKNPDWHHAHFALKFNKFVPGQRFYGMTDMNSKWFKDDAMYVREVYSYDLQRRFNVWTAPFSSYARLYIKIKEDSKPAYFGVYQFIESINQDFLNKRFPKAANGKADGNLWKGTYPNTGPADLTTKNLATRIGVEDPDNGIFKSYDLKTNKKTIDTLARPQLEQFISTLSTSAANQAWLEKNINTDQYLRALAVNVAVGSWDDYWVLGSNYYMYFDLDGKMNWIPYDYDNTLGTSLIVRDAGKQDVLRWGKFDNSRPLIFRMLSVSSYRAKYVQYLNELLDEQKNLFDERKSVTRIKSWHKLIAPYVTNDTGQDMTIVDRPASWGNAAFYRLFSGDETTNFFKAKAAAIRRAQP